MNEIADFIQAVGNQDGFQILLFHKAAGDAPVQHVPEGLIILADVEQNSRFGQISDFDQGHGLGDLVQRSDAAGESDIRVRQFQHLSLSGGHIRLRDDFRAEGLGTADDEINIARKDADDVPAVLKNGFRQDAHQADISSAEYKGMAVFRNPEAQVPGSLPVSSIIPEAASAIYRDVHVIMILF